MDGLWGLSTAEWTAIGTIVTAVAATVALVMNGRAGRRANLAAEAARDTASATREAAAAQMAAMPVDFEVELRLARTLLSELDLTPPVRLHVMKQNVFVHGLTVEWVEQGGRRLHREPPRECEPADGSKLPTYVAAGDRYGFFWPGDIPARDKIDFSFDVTYGFIRDPGSLMLFTRKVRPRDVSWSE